MPIRKTICEWYLLVTLAHIDEPHSDRHHRGSVLAVESNPANQKVARRFLERMGCAVTIAADGFEAVRTLNLAIYDLILIGVQMPMMDEYTATRRIRENVR